MLSIRISEINDFLFCPASIYFHNLYGDMEKELYQSTAQILGSAVHKSVDSSTYSNRASVLMGIDVYCAAYDLCGKIDIFFIENGLLHERKKHLSRVFDGHIFQLYAQCLSLREMGYDVKQLQIHSTETNRIFSVLLPEADPGAFARFQATIEAMRNFSMDEFQQQNERKCMNCIYEPACDRGAYV